MVGGEDDRGPMVAVEVEEALTAASVCPGLEGDGCGCLLHFCVGAGLEKADYGVCFVLPCPPDGCLLLELPSKGLCLALLLPEGKEVVVSPLLSLGVMKTRRCHLPLFLTAEQHMHTQPI